VNIIIVIVSTSHW